MKPFGEMTCKNPECGKIFSCYHPSSWAYQKYFDRETLFFCSWGCLQAHNRMVENGEIKRTRVRKKVAVQ